MYKTAIITGASRGVGKETARILYSEGYNLGLVSRTFPEEYSITESKDEGRKIRRYNSDLTINGDIRQLLKRIKEDFPSIDVLINNAGFNPRKARIEEYTEQEYSDIIDLNLKAPLLLTNGLLPIMKRQHYGHIINIIAAMAYLCKEDWGPYASSKAGLLAFSRVLSKECAKDNIKVTSIIPGGIDTTFRQERKPEYIAAESVAKMILQVINAPDDLVVHEMTIKPLSEIL